MIPVIIASSSGVHLVKPHGLRPQLEGHYVKTLCGRGGKVIAKTSRTFGLCADCREIERIAA